MCVTNLEEGSKFWSTRQRSWLRHYARSRNVEILGPDYVDYFNITNPSSLIMALGSNQK
jgi:hypothetical protein